MSGDEKLNEHMRWAMRSAVRSEESFRRRALEMAARAIERRAMHGATGRHVAEERLLARLRKTVTQALEGATSWGTVQARLRVGNVAYALAGGGLILTRASNGARLCKASDVGPGHQALARKLRAPFPAHRRGQVAQASLGEEERAEISLIDYAP